jgi:hypothetical protein
VVGWKLFLAFLFWILTTATVEASNFSASFYSENSYLSRESAEISQIRARASDKISDVFSPYLQVGNELAFTGGTIGTVESSYSFAYAAPGLNISLGPVQFFGECRFRQFYNGADPSAEGQGPIDVRGVLVYGNYFGTRISPVLSTDLFGEIYSEAVFTSADDSNLVVTGIGRWGGRISPFKDTSADLFVEVFATIDRLGHYYYNHADLRPTFRLQYVTPAFSVGLSVSYMLTYYYPLATFEPNPYINMPAGIRTLLVVGGSL